MYYYHPIFVFVTNTFFHFRSKIIKLEMCVSSFSKHVIFVLVLSQYVVGRTLQTEKPVKLPPTPLLLTSSTPRSVVDSTDPKTHVTETENNHKVPCSKLRTFRKSARKLFSESCKFVTDSSMGRKTRKKRLPENCLQFTKDHMKPCIDDDIINEECMERILNVSFI